MAATQTMIFALDDTDHSFYALEWTLDHFFGQFDSLFKLIIVHVKITPTSVVGLAGPGTDSRFKFDYFKIFEFNFHITL